MKQWVKKLLDQLDMDWEKSETSSKNSSKTQVDINEERATLLYMLDIYNKNLIETDKQPIRKVREALDNFAKALVDPNQINNEKLLFQLRQFFTSHRIEEYTFVQTNFNDFKKIIWDFADQLSEDIRFEQLKDEEAKQSFEKLREAVDSNSIETLRSKSREFIDFYIKHQSQKEERRTKRVSSIRKNLNVVKKQLTEANENMRTDHLTGAFNRMSFDEQLKKYHKLSEVDHTPTTLLMLDIDFFKKINDSYGHDIGDFVLKECVRLLKESFANESDFLARIGGEEFAVILPEASYQDACKRAEYCMAKIRKEVFVHGNLEIKFTVSMGIAEIVNNETVDSWIKRADTALYQSKNTGRNKYTVATPHVKIASVA